MNSIEANKYIPFYKITLTIPQAYDDTLSYYEALCKLYYGLNSLVDQLNTKWTEQTTEQFNKYLAEMFAANVTYTEEDKGLHLNISSAIASGDHVYEPDEQTMNIIEEDEDDGELTFKI